MTLSKLELGWARVLLTTMFPHRPESHVRFDVDRLGLGVVFAEALASVPLRVAVGLRLAIVAISLSPLWVIGRLSTLAGLAAADRERVVVALAASDHYVVRQLTLVLKAFFALFLFRDAELRAAVLKGPQRLAQLHSRPKGESIHDAVA